MLFIEFLWQDPGYYLTRVAIVAFSICVHECAHAWIALREGDDTACRLGYLTLNPVKVMGSQSLLMLALCGIAWGAVPVTPSAMRRRASRMIVACAGPFANLVLAVVFAVLTVGITRFGPVQLATVFGSFCATGVVVNYLLLLFNMLPVPFLDGWQLYTWFVPGLDRMAPEKRNAVSLVVILVIFLTPAGAVLWTGSSRLALATMKLVALPFGGL